MPLAYTSDFRLLSLEEAGENYEFLVFYSSIEPITKRMWCPDCLRVEQDVQAALEQPNDPSALVVFVGHRSYWKNPSASKFFRDEPWMISAVPTILRLKDNARLVDDDINESTLRQFIQRRGPVESTPEVK